MPQSLEQWSDEALADEAKSGSSACFDLLVRRYQTSLLGFLLRSLKRVDAEDVLQESFIQIYSHLDRYNSKHRFKTWAFVITRRLMIDRLRQIKRSNNRISGAEIEVATHHDPSIAMQKSEHSDRIWSIARQNLSDEPYQALWLHYVEGLDTHEVARVMKRSWVWVKTTLFRARRKLEPILMSETKSIQGMPLGIRAGETCQ